MEEQSSTQKGMPLWGWIAILAGLVAGVMLIFGMLEIVMPTQWSAQIWEEMQNDKGQTALYDLRMLNKTQRQEKDIRAWMERIRQEEQSGCAFWLYRKEQDEYVLCLPEQDRTLTNQDLSASEERDGDGEMVLVLRARTNETGEDVNPEEQLFCFRARSDTWRGIRVKVILDGREKEVHKLVAQENKLYSTEEVYIGRDIG